ncbi:MAG TPA: flagellar biosynthesis anti-sigma factor FlgM [Candidatus Binatia bacterium]|nr:flagellar biosynthesis anti-sigma factor FlgM [Candidatus Binatia bacterium]
MEVLCRIQNHKAIDRHRKKGTTVGQNREPAKVDISEQTWQLQRLAELARKVDELRAKRVRQIKQRIVKGEYKVHAQEVARSIIRTEMSRYPEKFDR